MIIIDIIKEEIADAQKSLEQLHNELHKLTNPTEEEKGFFEKKNGYMPYASITANAHGGHCLRWKIMGLKRVLQRYEESQKGFLIDQERQMIEMEELLRQYMEGLTTNEETWNKLVDLIFRSFNI